MKKLLLMTILMLALVLTVAACKADPTTETTGETTAAPAPADTTAEPDADTTAANAPATAEPETTVAADPETTEEVTTEEVTTEEVTADPMEPVNVFDAEALNTLTGANEVEATEVVNGYLHVVPKGPDPYWYPFANVKGARYVVIRYRTADAVGADVQLYIGSHGTAPVDDGSMLRQPAIVDGEWHLAIFDTQSLIDAGIYNGQHVSFFRLDPIEAGYILDENGQPYKPDGLAYARYELPEGCSVDVSYVAFFHSIEAAEAYEAKVNPPYIDADNPDAGKKNHSFDTFYVNGSMYFPEDGGAGDKLAAQNNTVTFGMDDLCDSMMLRGWIGFTQPIMSFGYYIDSYKMIYKDFATATEDDVKAAGGEHASRFEILVPLAELESGVHTVGFVAMLEDGTVVRLRDELKVVIVPYTVDETVSLATGHGAPFSGAPNNYFGQRFNVGENILKQITITDMATYSDGNTNTWSFKIWQWKGDYATTTAAEPLFVAEGENHNDNAPFTVTVPVEAFITGDIYYEITYLTGSGCFTGWTADTVAEGVETYVAGSLATGSYSSSIVVGVPSDEPEKETVISVVFGEIYTDEDKGTKFDGNLILEKNLGPTYFDGVRAGDWMEFGINVETAGDYNVCMVFGWLDHTGVYTILVDGEEVGKIENTISGTDWRAWTDTSTIKINLTEGEHTVRVVMGSDGPNVYGIKFTYTEPMPESIALNKPISADSVEKPQHEAIYANDGDENTRWCGLPKGEANLILDLEAVYTLDKICLLLENAMGDFTISVSENGEDYTEVCACEGKPMSPVAFTLEFDMNGATGRYIKITRDAVDDNVDYWFSIFELYVYSVQ